MRHFVTASAFVTALALSTPSAIATPSTPIQGDGKVCFYAEPRYRGTSWCYRPSGYAEVPDRLHGRVRSFKATSSVIVYAIDHGRGGRCSARRIWVDSWSPDWAWGSRMDGVGTDDQGCRTG
ncbi:hypothetical protein GKJPGBOP_07341 [Streptomyces paromomycinus]|uniref:Secreted protein n=1 Tax=Streptomyces paromomycinus TaxID=92743 RepID=A0A401WE61_STREY|nr:hypothetical protein GKJPGBOP_07341 [Streptomyces paromomycinus]